MSSQTGIYIVWCVVRCKSKNHHQKDMYMKHTGLSKQALLTIIGSNSRHKLGGPMWLHDEKEFYYDND